MNPHMVWHHCRTSLLAKLEDGAVVGLLLSMIHIFSVLPLHLNKLRRHNESAVDPLNANLARGHEEARRSHGHIMVTTHYSSQQEYDPNRDKIPCQVQPLPKQRKLVGVKTVSLGTNYSLKKNMDLSYSPEHPP